MAIKPPMLHEGDTIGIVTLGTPLYAEAIDVGIDTLKKMGFRVVLGKSVYAANGFLAGTEQERAADLMDMFRNPDIKAIIPTRGGVGVAGILAHLDYALIKQNPKIVTGYSDITILLNVLYAWADLITFHSLLLVDFRPTTPPYNYDQFFAAVSTAAPTRQLMNHPNTPFVSIVEGNVTGTIIGGNLTSFVDHIGTPFELDTAGKIILIEDVKEPISKVYRYLKHLIMAGVFRDCAGIIVGECTKCEPSYKKTFADLVNDVLVPLNKPLMTHVALGHGRFKMAIPIGAIANLNTIENTITITEPTVTQ